jgi:hypothetical protein
MASNLERGRKKTGGRKKGTVNKTTQLAKDAIAQAAASLGGTERLVKWVQEDPLNERVFWSQIYTKLMPVQVETGPGGFTVKLEPDVRKL